MNPKSSGIEGPFSIELLNQMIASAEIGSDLLATSDLGESLAQIKKQRSRDWVALGNIPGIMGIPMVEKEHAPRLSTEAKAALIVIVLGILAVTLWWLLKAGASSGLSDS